MSDASAPSELPHARPDWDDYVVVYAMGVRSFPIPGHSLRAMPWPLEWVLEDPPATEDSNQVIPVEGLCCVSGVTVDRNTGVRCARCARAVAAQHAGLSGAAEDVPSCPTCRPIVLEAFAEGLRTPRDAAQ